MGNVKPSPRMSRILALAVSLVVLLGGLALQHGSSQAVSAELSPLETRVLGQNQWLAGGPASVRIIVSDHRNDIPVRAAVAINLVRVADGKPTGDTCGLFKGRTDAQGTLDAQFTAPDAPGTYKLTVSVDAPLGADEITQTITLTESAQVLLTCDKPLYQPGQTIHLRALALDLATRNALSGQRLTFEVEDARGNKVFKKAETLSKFGVAGVDFTLANEVNMGTYTLRALLASGNTEKKVRVERYVLPKFKVALTTAKPYYLPGETVHGTVQADYFFGKPVAKGMVTIDVSTVDIGVSKLAELQGTTDANGTYKFEYTLPNSFVGQPFEQGKAVVGFNASIIDPADHMQEANATVPVVKDPVLVVVVPESPTLTPGMPNRLYIALASPDGAPLRKTPVHISTSLTRTMFSRVTDEMGIATLDITPRGTEPVTVTVRPTVNGKSYPVSRVLQTSSNMDGVILRTDKPLVKVGDRVNLTVLSTKQSGTTYLDIIRNKQTILTKALPTVNGRAALALPITNDMLGTVELRAYRILPNEEIIRDTQVMIVSPATDLQIKVDADQTTYRPGQEAKLTFTVTDTQKHPILAALGVAIVDESVFALSELQPGLEKIYFTLEKELMEPKYEIHGLRPADMVNPRHGTQRPIDEAGRQRAAALLFAAVPVQGEYGFHVNTYQQRWELLRETVMKEMASDHQRIMAALGKYAERTGQQLTARESLFALVRRGYLRASDLRDHWGNFYKTDMQGNNTYSWFTLKSAGPDGRWGTVDDIDWQWESRRDRLVFEELDGGRAMVFKAAGNMAAGAPMLPAPAAILQNRHALSDVRANDVAGGGEPVRIREYFPETMYWNPAIITDERGRAQIAIPMADSITTWRMSIMGNSVDGLLGSATSGLRVFQDFFVDIDLPIALTQHDRIEIPVAVYNYLPGAQTVTLTLEKADWFTLEGDAVKTVEMGKDDVKVVYFPITVEKIGRFPLTVHAKGTKLADAMRRSIDVLPDGKEVRETVNDRLEGKVEQAVAIPPASIDGASTIWVKLYPGTFSQVVEGLDGLLRMPNGCFEQTSSTTYPNVLVLDYLKQNKKINPELQMKAEGYINVGYQRLVTFECKSGGFSWFGDEPAHQILTAYGLLEFSDMAKVHEVDSNLIARTQQWLANRQERDGSWKPQDGGIAEGIINRQTGALRTTAYIAWALAESDFNGPQLAAAVQYVKAHRSEAKDPYTLAVILNLLTKVERDSEIASVVAQQLIDMAKTTTKGAYWASDTQTFTGAREKGADLETTGLAAYGLVKWGRNAGFTGKVLTHLIQSKDSFGTWESTQGTVWSLKALLFAGSNSMGGGKGTVTVLVNGEKAATFAITPEDSDVMRQVDAQPYSKEGANSVTLEYVGEGSLLYQIVSRYYLPWDQVAKMPQAEAPMHIAVKYDKTTLAKDDTATVTVTITNNTNKVVEMPLIDLGIPPGFTVVTDELDNAVAKKTISKYTLAARQIIVYLEKLTPKQTVTLTYQIKAKYPIKARTPQSTAYPYYNPEQAAVSAPQTMTVR